MWNTESVVYTHCISFVSQSTETYEVKQNAQDFNAPWSWFVHHNYDEMKTKLYMMKLLPKLIFQTYRFI